MSLKSVNLNLLPVLRELLRLRSVSAAGRALGRSPPAISEGLAQLRQTFGDPLLVRVAGRMELTPRALELVAPVEAICAGIEHLVEPNPTDPRESERLFVIAAHDFHVFSVGPDLVHLFHRIAPRFTLRFIDLGRNLAEQFAAREVDLALMPDFHLGDLAPARLLHQPLMVDRTAALMREGHPLAVLGRINREALADYEQIAFHPNWEPVDYRKAIGAFRRNLPIRARIAQVTMLPFFLMDSDYVALAPETLGQRLGYRLGLVHRPLDMGEPEIRSVMAWSPVQDADPAHRWFRQQIAAFMLPREEASHQVA